ncbi:MAG: hypothetical protein ACREHF_07715 [Rhizomicrobium sp.]
MRAVRRVTGGTHRVEGKVGAAYDMRFISSDSVIAATNGFKQGGPDSTTDGRINILIDAESMSHGTNHGENFLIETNVFGERPVNPFATSAIVATQSAQNIQIGATNAYNGQFGGPVVDDASGTAAAPVGFPTTNNPGNPAAVVPNTGGGVTPGPTMGNGTLNGTWLANYAYGQFVVPVPPNVTLPAVSSGWSIQYDPKTTDLVATNGSVTRTLASS